MQMLPNNYTLNPSTSCLQSQDNTHESSQTSSGSTDSLSGRSSVLAGSGTSRYRGETICARDAFFSRVDASKEALDLSWDGAQEVRSRRLVVLNDGVE